MVQLYAFPARSRREAAAAAAARGQGQDQLQGEGGGESTAETAKDTTEGGADAVAGPQVPGDATMEDVAGAAGGGVVVPAEGETCAGGGGGNAPGAEEEGLPVLLLRELASFRARFPQRVGKHLRPDAAELVLKHQVRVPVERGWACIRVGFVASFFFGSRFFFVCLSVSSDRFGRVWSWLYLVSMHDWAYRMQQTRQSQRVRVLFSPASVLSGC